MRLIAVGRLRPGPEAELFERYNIRLRPKFSVTEVPEGHGAPAEITRREADALLAALPAEAFAVALDLGTKPISSEEFAREMQNWLSRGKSLAFLIGGAEGLAPPVLARANAVFSLGRLTWPHMLVRVMLAEQVFRAQCILGGHPYHRSGRPQVGTNSMPKSSK